MRLLALACDYDGTLAHHGTVPQSTIAKLEELVRSGRKLIMVTGRELEDLQRVFARLDLFHAVVAENGGLLYLPSTKESRPLCERPDPNFVGALRSKQVEPLSVGHTIVATWEPHEKTVLETIQELGLELQVIFNKGAVMILPTGVNKGTGLALALKELQLSPRNCVGVGDAENDHAFLSTCELAVAVANALPSVKERSDVVTERSRGAGVEELIIGCSATIYRRY